MDNTGTVYSILKIIYIIEVSETAAFVDADFNMKYVTEHNTEQIWKKIFYPICEQITYLCI